MKYTLALFLLIATQAFSQTNKSSVKEVYISKIPKPTAPAYLIVSAINFSDRHGNNNQLLDANENAEIKFTLSNKGKGDAYNLVAKINETNQVKGIEYQNEKIIGNLQAGKDLILSIPIAGSMQLESGKAEFEILVKEGNDFDADLFRISFNAQKFKNPDVAIADSKFTADEEGMIKLGHPVSLNIVVQNKGQGNASDIIVSFINPPNVFPANESTFTINTLKPNETRNISYEFFANKKYSGSDIPINVIISESYKKYGENKTLTVSLVQTLSKTQQIDVNTQYEKPVAIDIISLTSDVDKNIPVNDIYDENKFALIIGNEDYSNFQEGISTEMNVEFARNDALIFKEYCLKTFGVPEKNITCLLNATSGKTSQAIDKLSKLIQATNGIANVIVYYAGHGLPDETTKEPYIIPVDVSGSNISTAIKLSSFYQKLTEYPSQQITVFLDACFSGGGREAGLLAARSVKITPKNGNLKGNIVVFTASSGEESSLPWKDKQHGMFTYFVLKKFQETKGNVSFLELSTFIKDKVAIESLRTNSKNQTPQVLFSPEETENWGKLRLK
ncbi:MAG: caspase family protein [Bacteroidota bacterium]